MNNQLFPLILLGLSNCICLPAYAWDAIGHRVIAEIAYDHLTPSAQDAANDLIDRLSDQYPQSSTFQTASAWADYLRHDDVDAFNSWHFINIPYSPDDTALPNIDPENVVWAINQSENVLRSDHASEFEKALFFRFLVHFVGDAHQPLHCISLYSKTFPHGDNGGNLYPISGEQATNLHAFWDEGLGLFDDSSCHYQPFKSKQVDCIASQIETAYPPSYFAGRDHDLNPADWTQESYNLAKSFVYSTPENATPNAAYVNHGQQIAEQQMALAGYRLANLLNNLLASS